MYTEGQGTSQDWRRLKAKLHNTEQAQLGGTTQSNGGGLGQTTTVRNNTHALGQPRDHQSRQPEAKGAKTEQVRMQMGTTQANARLGVNAENGAHL